MFFPGWGHWPHAQPPTCGTRCQFCPASTWDTCPTWLNLLGAKALQYSYPGHRDKQLLHHDKVSSTRGSGSPLADTFHTPINNPRAACLNLLPFLNSNSCTHLPPFIPISPPATPCKIFFYTHINTFVRGDGRFREIICLLIAAQEKYYCMYVT